MRYSVIRQTKTGWQEVAQTLYLEDAEVVFNNWNQVYIAHRGEIVKQKNITIDGPTES